ncbi:MAG: alanine racemase [Marinomonas sp.]
MARPLTAHINLAAIKHNYDLAKKLQPNAKAFAVVKANAYGHGAAQVAQYLDDSVDAFAVAAIEEALELREANVRSPILLLEGVFEVSEWQVCEDYDFWVAIENEIQLEGFLSSGVKLGKVFLKLDSGMHRLGVQPSAIAPYVAQLKSCERIGELVLMTHFSSADDLNSPATHEQLDVFKQTHDAFSELEVSVANSAAILKWALPEGGWIRPGIMLYGISPFDEISAQTLGLKPAMTLTSQVISLRDIADGEAVGYARAYVAKGQSKIATVAVGYGDGYPRMADHQTPVLVKQNPCCISGRVSMDMITLDVTSLPQTQVGDEVILWGEGNPVEKVAAHSSTIAYELVTRMTGRAKRQYHK